jgi:undecaprenyl-diphosphatase
MLIKEFFLELPRFINSLPDHGYLIILIFSFLEAFAFFGVLIPGTIIVIILGFFAFLGYWNFFAVFLLIFFGAVIGDTFSYWLGKKYGTQILAWLNKSRLYRWLGIDMAMNFLGANEQKSVVVGRIIGPTRAFIPFLVGSTNTKFRTFFRADILSVFLWSALYLGIGAMFGTSMYLIEKLLDHIESLFLSIVAIMFLISLISRYIMDRAIKKETPTGQAPKH